MNELINKLAQMGQSGSLKQCQLNQLLAESNMNPSQVNHLMRQSQEYSCILLPDDDED